MLRKVVRICGCAAAWALAWGMTGATVGAIVAVFQPDTGHIPSSKMPILIGVPSTVFGLFAGLVYGTLVTTLGNELRLGTKGKAILGAGIGCVVGAAFMRVLVHSYLAIFLGGLVGVVLAISFFKTAPAVSRESQMVP